MARTGVGAVGAEGRLADLDQLYPTIDDKPTVAYLWARTVICKKCGRRIPLLKTRWLCKKDNKRVVLRMEVRQNKSGARLWG